MSAPDSTERAMLPLRFEGVGLDRNGRTLLHDLTFEISAGGVTVILGPNGAGKSLTLRLAHGLLGPTRGQVAWECPTEAARRDSALLFQHPVLLRRSARANVGYALALRGVPRARRTSLAQTALAAMGLSAVADQPAQRLSGGERQRLALARAQALSPRVLFLDEPASALDPAATEVLEAAILSLRDSGTKVILTTHDLAQARRMADDILLLHRGRLIERSPAAAFFTAPATETAQQFLDRRLSS